jgi:zinc transport system substrate-binding protein
MVLMISRAVRRVRAFGIPALAVALLVGGVSGCADPGPQTGSPTVAAAFYPLAFVAQRVAADHAEVVNLTSPGGEPHDLELTVNEAVTVADAALVVYLRGFQPSVDETVDTAAEGRVLDAGTVVDLQPDPQAPDAVDPHFWLDPLRMAGLADAVASEMGVVDPAHRTDYARNASDLRGQLAALDTAYAEGLASCEVDTIVVSHDAFGYLERYGLTVEAINGLSPDAEPAPADLARLQQLVRDEGITTVFSETLASPKLAETLAGDLGIRTAVLDPIEGLSDATEDEDYLSLMRENLAALKEANRC